MPFGNDSTFHCGVRRAHKSRNDLSSRSKLLLAYAPWITRAITCERHACGLGHGASGSRRRKSGRVAVQPGLGGLASKGGA